jgi:hypothetical protein
MEVYLRETQEIVRRFLKHKLTFPECISALNAALAALVPHLKPKRLRELGAVMLANNETVMKEMHKREGQHKAQAKLKARKIIQT